MIVIIEGENKTGKSTICEYIFENYNTFNYKKFSQPKGDPYIEYMEALKIVCEEKNNWVFDRFFIGEPVYGQIYRGKSGLSKEQCRNIQLKLMSLNTLVIYCFDTAENIITRFKACAEEFAHEKHVVETLKLFDVQLSNLFLPYKKHQMKTDSDLLRTGKLDELINEYLRKQISCYKTIIGNVTNPRYIFIGDCHNDKIKPEYKDFFQPFDFGRSSNFLFNSLSKADIDLSKSVFVNSDSSELCSFLDNSCLSLDKTKIIALGHKAANVLTVMKYDFIKLNHPQFESRFHFYSSKFVNQLKDIKND